MNTKTRLLLGEKSFNLDQDFNTDVFESNRANNNATAVIKQSQDSLSKTRSVIFGEFQRISSTFDNLSKISPEVLGFEKSDLQEVSDKILEGYDALEALVLFLGERYEKIITIQEELFHS